MCVCPFLVCLRAGNEFPFERVPSSHQERKATIIIRGLAHRLVGINRSYNIQPWPPISFPIYFLISSYTLSSTEAQANSLTIVKKEL